eukprot:GFUD01019472.1.p1 GENE.GFUD01019472.1~~GFUD01019472.1.p1  ORF type:complete len:153 (-),score=50.79 GFUD01019472.1:98-556(-)
MSNDNTKMNDAASNYYDRMLEIQEDLAVEKKKVLKLKQKLLIQKLKNEKLRSPLLGESEVGEELTAPSCQTKKSILSVFEVEDDPYVLEIFARKKKEAEKLADRTKAKAKGRKRESMAKMAEFSLSITGSQSSHDCSQESESDDGGDSVQNS